MKNLTPKQADQFLQDNPAALFVDCRTEMEYLFIGHPVGALHVAWKDGPNWDYNPDFTDDVRRHAGTDPDRPIVVICRSGVRSLEACMALEAAGFTRTYNVLFGFEGDLDEQHRRGTKNGWRFDGLPWEQC